MSITGVDVLVAVATFFLGYVIGSLPLSALVGHAAGVDAYTEGEANPGSANVWKLAGPGWGLLALVADLARGILPVSLAAVTFSWAGGWTAGLGALVGASWPALGRLRGGRGVGVLTGVLIALEPAAGLLAAVLALAVALGARAVGRNGRAPAVAIGIGAYPVFFLLLELNAARLAAVMTLYLVAALRFGMTRR